MSLKKITIYTDGACSGNPGPGGWGALLIYGEHEKELFGGEEETTVTVIPSNTGEVVPTAISWTTTVCVLVFSTL